MNFSTTVPSFLQTFLKGRVSFRFYGLTKLLENSGGSPNLKTKVTVAIRLFLVPFAIILLLAIRKMSSSLLILLFACFLIGQSSGFIVSTSLCTKYSNRCIISTPSSPIALPTQSWIPSSSSHRNHNNFRLFAEPPKPAGRGPPPRKAPKDDVVQVNGKVLESLPNAMFRVEIEPSKAVVLTTISGKIRKNSVRIVVGDSVVCELSAYDLTRGRITYRNK